MASTAGAPLTAIARRRTSTAGTAAAGRARRRWTAAAARVRWAAWAGRSRRRWTAAGADPGPRTWVAATEAARSVTTRSRLRREAAASAARADKEVGQAPAPRGGPRAWARGVA